MKTTSRTAPFHLECLNGQPCGACRSEAERWRLDSETADSYLRCVARALQLQGERGTA